MAETHTVDSLDELGDEEVISAIAECVRDIARLTKLRDDLIRVGMSRPAERVRRIRMAEAAGFSGATPITRLYQIRDGR